MWQAITRMCGFLAYLASRRPFLYSKCSSSNVLGVNCTEETSDVESFVRTGQTTHMAEGYLKSLHERNMAIKGVPLFLNCQLISKQRAHVTN